MSKLLQSWVILSQLFLFIGFNCLIVPLLGISVKTIYRYLSFCLFVSAWVLLLSSLKKKKKKNWIESFYFTLFLRTLRHNPSVFSASLNKYHISPLFASLWVFCSAGFFFKKDQCPSLFLSFQAWWCICSGFMTEQDLN